MQGRAIPCDAASFDAHAAGAKNHVVAKMDETAFSIGDELDLIEVGPDGSPTGRKLVRVVSYITSAEFPCALSDRGLRDGHAILSLAEPSPMPFPG